MACKGRYPCAELSTPLVWQKEKHNGEEHHEHRERDIIMEEGKRSSCNSFTSAMTLTQMEVPHVPTRYILPPSQRPNPSLVLHSPTTLPIIDLSCLHDPSIRHQVVEEVKTACNKMGFFQAYLAIYHAMHDFLVINHGIPLAIMEDALNTAAEFFNLPNEEKMLMVSDDVHEPVRYGMSINHAKEKFHFWRDFIKHYSHPISKWIDRWPSNPITYREKMGIYTKAVHALQVQLMEVVLESLGLNPNCLCKDIQEGSQLNVVNCYPTCPEPDLALGMPPHSDFGSITILLQSCQGLELMDWDNQWYSVPVIEGALIVQLGDQMEVMSNGAYKSVVQRVMVSSENKRLSIASLHSLALERKVCPAPELIDQEHPVRYNECSFEDFLNFLTCNDITEGRYIDTLKKINQLEGGDEICEKK
ncbi:Isopenicillin N synthase-like, Fe(2+) 2OG dioxygenase domain [Dillenia turbinata]|uniref:Isopenicillin N synthase-like, Fe(2+) 2OG dioxygenase domain n=1 Tax=Dillenia turbinata TaxID=194707 RepID=A0AAN8Z0W3_9MAGN